MQGAVVVRWSLAPLASPDWRCWGADDGVVHHLLANDTHRLSGSAGRILQYLARVESIDSYELARACSIAEDEASAALMALAELGFIEPC